jgi:ketosteroid isomerase-like protein
VFVVACGLALLAPSLLVAPEAAAAAPVHLQGSDSVEATQAVVDAFGAGLVAQKYQLLDPLYSRDIVYDDFTFGVHSEFKPYVMWYLRRDLRLTDAIRVLATHADRGWGVIEHTWDYHTVNGIWLQPLTLLEIRNGQIVYEAWYFQDPLVLADGRPPEPTPLATAPGPADTAGSAEAVALEYALALQAKDAGTMAALSASQIAFMDTAAGSVACSPHQVRANYAGIFKSPADLVFEDLRYVCGAGWAAVVWTASAQSLGTSGEGATMLEIRNGKIVRETLYYTFANVPFGV